MRNSPDYNTDPKAWRDWYHALTPKQQVKARKHLAATKAHNVIYGIPQPQSRFVRIMKWFRRDEIKREVTGWKKISATVSIEIFEEFDIIAKEKYTITRGELLTLIITQFCDRER